LIGQSVESFSVGPVLTPSHARRRGIPTALKGSTGPPLESLRRVPAAGDLIYRSLHRRNGRVPP
jgi:hypothetical protein